MAKTTPKATNGEKLKELLSPPEQAAPTPKENQ